MLDTRLIIRPDYPDDLERCYTLDSRLVSSFLVKLSEAEFQR